MAAGTPALAVDSRQLTPQMRRLVAALGVPATLALLEARGGTRIYLSGGNKRSDRRLLQNLIGTEAADAFYAAFAGDGQRSMDLPKADRLVIQFRDSAIRAENAAGASLNTLAMKYRLTRRTITSICAAQPAPEWQNDPAQMEFPYGKAERQ